ncbi:hypothetical protein Tco_1506923 [Tanacetum coccineum]
MLIEKKLSFEEEILLQKMLKLTLESEEEKVVIAPYCAHIAVTLIHYNSIKDLTVNPTLSAVLTTLCRSVARVHHECLTGGSRKKGIHIALIDTVSPARIAESRRLPCISCLAFCHSISNPTFLRY